MTFDQGAAWYDALANRPGRLEREGPLLGRCLADAPSNRVVDIACGTGLHALHFAESGAQVTALDLSAEMVAFARAHRPHANIRYETGDMRAVAGGPYGLAICLGNSLALIDVEEGLQAVFRSVSNALAPGGAFLLQLVNGDAPAAAEARQRVEQVTLPDGTGELVVVKSLVPHSGRTLLSIAYFVLDGDEASTVAESSVLRHWTLDELDAAATGAGLTRTGTWGGFDAPPFEPPVSGDLIAQYRLGPSAG